VRALWRGVLPALGANAPFSAVHYACYSRLQAEIARRRPASSPSSPATNFAAGGVASALATLATQPFDVLRTRGSLEAGYVFIVSQPALEKTRLPAALCLCPLRFAVHHLLRLPRTHAAL